MDKEIDNRLPRYEQMCEAFRRRITSGEWRPGLAVPSEAELAKEYKVALGTVRQAIGRAVDEGFLERIHGKGTFVRSGLQHAHMFRFFRFREQPGEDGATVPHAVIHELREIKLCSDVAGRLGVKDSSRGIFIRRVRILNDTPHLLEKIWLPYAPFKRLLSVDPSEVGDLLYPWYREQCDVVITRASEEISFGLLAKPDALLLRLPISAPVAIIHRTAYSLVGAPVEYRITQGDAQRFHYNVEIK